MEFDSKQNDAREDGTLGADNADILAAKRRREAAASSRTAKSAPAVNADALRAQMRSSAARPVQSSGTSAHPVQPRAVRPSSASSAASVRPSVPVRSMPARAASSAAPKPHSAGEVPMPAQKNTSRAAISSGAGPTSPVAGVRAQTAAGAASSGETVRRSNTPASAAALHTESAGRAEPVSRNEAQPQGIHALIPFQNASVQRQKKEQGSSATRETDISGIRAAVPKADGETRLTDMRDVRAVRRVEKKKEEQKDESEGGNTVISIIKAITYIVAVVIVSVFLSIFVILVGNDVYAFVKDDTTVEVTIPEYATLNDISEILFENNIIKYPSVFKLFANLKKDSGVFLAGEYTLSPMMNYEELLLAFKPKAPSGISRITIPEGYTTDEIIDLFVSKGIGTREKYIDVINNYEFDYWFIDALEKDGMSEDRYYRLDGYLFPDTYEFYNASSEEVVINKLLKRFNEVFIDSYAQKAKANGYTVDQVLIIASMIEKEAGSQADFFDISSVFNNRLRNSSVFPYLESDATIVYAIQHDTGERVTLTGEDTAYESPYNTYTNRGLPPGPIANPSASAIRAALYPSETNYYFFVSASSRLTYFASTAEEHQKNIEKIKSGEITAPPDSEPTA